jgi:hypothetical protein
MRRLRLAVLVLVLAALCSVLLLPSFSGIHGKVVSRSCPITPGPATNACYPPIINPVRARVVINNVRGVQLATVVCLSDGTFSVNLAPGTYLLSGESLGSGQNGQIGITRVDVRPLRYEDLTLEMRSLAAPQ